MEPSAVSAREGRPLLEGEIRELEPVMFRFALRATGDPDLSRDLVQDALLAALTAPAFGGRAKLRTWLIGILSHKLIDQYRRKASRPLESDDDPDLLEVPSEGGVERVIAARQQLAFVETALRTLPELERLAVLLNAEGMEREEICHALEVNATHLRVLLHRGRHKLRRALEQ